MTARLNSDDPMFQPLTLEQVLEITGRTRRTVERWVKDGRLTRYEETHRRKIVLLYNEDDVTEIEKERNDAAFENRERIRRRGGRPGPRKPPGETTA